MEIKKMQKCHVPEVEQMAKKFYYSDAVCHEIPWENIRNSIETAVSENNILDGYVFDVNGEIAGFGFITQYFETECGGVCVQIIDLYVDDKFRKQGIAKQYFDFVFKTYSHAKRFRLEVVEDNYPALSLYGQLGFTKLNYMQMIKEMY